MISSSALNNHRAEQAFRLIEPLLAHFVRHYPEPVEFTKPPGITIETYDHKIRKSIREYELFRWPASFTPEMFSPAWKASVISVVDANTLRMGPRNGAATQAKPFALAPPEGQRMVDKPLTTGAILAILLLHHEGFFVEPTHIPMSVELFHEMEQMISDRELDCALATDPGGGYVLF